MDWALDQISQHRQMWPQVELLEHHAEPGPHAGELPIGHGTLVPGCGATHADTLASQEHRAFVRPLEKVDAPQEGRLPRAARSEDAERAPRRDREIDAAEHMKRTEALAEPADLHDGLVRAAALTHGRVPVQFGPCGAPSIRLMSRSTSRDQRRRAWLREARSRWTGPGWP